MFLLAVSSEYRLSLADRLDKYGIVHLRFGSVYIRDEYSTKGPRMTPAIEKGIDLRPPASAQPPAAPALYTVRRYKRCQTIRATSANQIVAASRAKKHGISQNEAREIIEKHGPSRVACDSAARPAEL